MKRRAAAQNPGSSGSFFAFHGSNSSNWHGIFREGLKNMSGTLTGQQYPSRRPYHISALSSES